MRPEVAERIRERASALGLLAGTPVVAMLSGGADSTLLVVSLATGQLWVLSASTAPLTTGSAAQVALAAALLLVALSFIVQRTRTGMAMRAVAFNPQAAQLMSIFFAQNALKKDNGTDQADVKALPVDGLRYHNPTPEVLRVCSWHKRMAVGDEWREPEVVVSHYHLLEGTPAARITHGICPDCEDKFLKDAKVR